MQRESKEETIVALMGIPCRKAHVDEWDLIWNRTFELQRMWLCPKKHACKV